MTAYALVLGFKVSPGQNLSYVVLGEDGRLHVSVDPVPPARFGLRELAEAAGMKWAARGYHYIVPVKVPADQPVTLAQVLDYMENPHAFEN